MSKPTSMSKAFLAAKTTTKTKPFVLANYLNRRRVTCLTIEFYLSFISCKEAVRSTSGCPAPEPKLHSVVYMFLSEVMKTLTTLI